MKLITPCAFLLVVSHSFGSSAQTFSKIEETSYYDDKSVWVLDQVERKSINSIESLRITYGPKAMPWTVAVFGKLQQTLTYNTDGTLASVRDGNNNPTVLSNWHRGVPRSIAYPDGRTRSASVNDAGWVTSTVAAA
jgi:hypothetical protein